MKSYLLMIARSVFGDKNSCQSQMAGIAAKTRGVIPISILQGHVGFTSVDSTMALLAGGGHDSERRSNNVFEGSRQGKPKVEMGNSSEPINSSSSFRRRAMSCSHEAHDHDHSGHSHHGHNHGHGHDDHDHDHDHDGPDRGAEFSLYRHIDVEKVRCLNESIDGSCRDLFKPWNERLDEEKVGWTGAPGTDISRLFLHL